MRQQLLVRLTPFVALLSSAAVFASSINDQFFIPSSGYDFVYSEDALMNTREGFTLGVTYDYLKNPLVTENSNQTANTGTVISSLSTLDLSGSYRITDSWLVGVSLPLNLVAPEGLSSQFALGDSRLFAKHRLSISDDAKTATALVFDLRVPTGNATYYLSDTSLAVGFRYVLEHDFGFMQLVGNAGYLWASYSNVSAEGLSYRNRIPLSLSSRFPIGGNWAINLEGSGDIPMPLNSNQNPGEGYLGLQYQTPKGASFFGGGAIGKLTSVGADDFRIILGLRASFESVSIVPEEAPPPKLPAVALAPEPPKKPRVVFTPTEITISEQVNFETGKATLTAAGKDLLNEVAEVIRSNLAHLKKVRIEGHTDRHGGAEYNLRLSQARATSVKNYIISRGIDSSKLESQGYGKTKPKAASNLTAKEQDAINRRVEFVVIN